MTEPSAGNGSFSNRIPGCLAFDVHPQHSGIIKQDFLEYKYNGNVPRNKILCIGNPPFGRQSSLAIKFVKKCAEFADTIAFILPLSCKKLSVQKRFPKNFHLVQQIEIPVNSFLFNDADYTVPCIFQIWENNYSERKMESSIEPLGFKYTTPMQAHIAIRRVGFHAGKAFFDLNKSIQSHYFIVLDDISNVKLVHDYLNDYQWEHRNTVGPRSISKQELNLIINNVISKKK